jgi:hypothetical protein
MRSAEAGTVPDTRAYRRPCAQHHSLRPCARTAYDPCVPYPESARPAPGVSGHGRARRPETARLAMCLKAVRAFTPGLAVTA